MTGRFVLPPAEADPRARKASLADYLQETDALLRLLGPPREPRPRLEWREVRL